MWTLGRYLPVAPFSLKSASATSSGGKTVLVPTPYAIKMALLDVAIRSMGVAEGERWFPLLRDLSIWLEAPDDLIVLKSFGKIQRLLKDKNNAEKAQEAQERGHWPMQPTIAYREYVYYRDAFQLAFSAPDGALLPEEFSLLLMGINYLGKRGGFVQLANQPRQVEQLPTNRFIELTAAQLSAFHARGTLQMLDDCGPTLTFQRANIYSQERITLGKDRILRHVVLPYTLTRSSRSYSWYTYLKEEG
jgi:hypothetical protein